MRILLKKYDQDYYIKVKEILDNFEKVQDGIPLYERFIQDINNEGFYLYVPNFPDISYKEIYKEFAEPYAKKFNPDLLKKSKVVYKKELFDWLRKKWKFKDPFELTFDSEIEAFRRFVENWPENSILLIDTYDTLKRLFIST